MLKKKVVLALVLSVTMMVTGLYGCGGKTDPAEETTPAEVTAPVEETTPADDPAAADDSAAATDDAPLIAYSDAGLVNSWRVISLQDVERAATEAGLRVITADGNMDPAKQLADIENMIVQQPDVLIVAPCESQALTPVVDMCNEANIPLVVIDRTLAVEPGEGMYMAEIVQSHEYSAIQLAEKTVEILTEKYGEPKGNVVKLQGQAGASVTEDSQRGWDAVMADYPNIKLVGIEDTGFTKEGGMTVMENFLQSFPEGEIDVVWSEYSDMTMGGIQAINNAGRTELFGYIVGEGGHYLCIEEVLKGNIARETQTPPYYGDAAIKAALDIIAGNEIEAKQTIEIKIFDASDPAPVQEYYDSIMAANLEF